MSELTLKQIYEGVAFIVALIGGFTALANILKKPMDKVSGQIEKVDNKVTKMGNDLDQVKDGTMNSLRQSLVRDCEHCIALNQISNDQLQMILDAYESYKNLGGDGYVTNLVEKTKSLPLVIK